MENVVTKNNTKSMVEPSMIEPSMVEPSMVEYSMVQPSMVESIGPREKARLAFEQSERNRLANLGGRRRKTKKITKNRKGSHKRR
jgi:hypothetical protein